MWWDLGKFTIVTPNTYDSLALLIDRRLWIVNTRCCCVRSRSSNGSQPQPTRNRCHAQTTRATKGNVGTNDEAWKGPACPRGRMLVVLRHPWVWTGATSTSMLLDCEVRDGRSGRPELAPGRERREQSPKQNLPTEHDSKGRRNHREMQTQNQCMPGEQAACRTGRTTVPFDVPDCLPGESYRTPLQPPAGDTADGRL